MRPFFYLNKKILPTFLLAILCMGLLYSCKSPEKSKRSKTILFDRSADYLFEKLDANDFNYDWLTAKYSASIRADGKDNSFKASLKAKKDSIIWMSISPALGIELARIKLTSDSVFIINRLNSTYFKGDYHYINNLINADLNYQMIQSLLFGTKYIDSNQEEFKSFVDENQYLLSTIRKRKLKRTIQKNDSLNLEVQSIWLDPSNYKITKYRFIDFSVKRELDVYYSNFSKIDQHLFPLKIEFNLNGEKNVSILVEFTKVIPNEPQSLPFNIPNKYEPIY